MTDTPNPPDATNAAGATQVLIATFGDEETGGRGLALLAPGLEPGAISMAAVVVKTEAGKVRFVETHDKTMAQGAVSGGGAGAMAGLIGLMFGPVALLGAPIGAAVGALIGKFRDTGFEDDHLKGLGEDLPAGGSALIVVIDSAQIDKAKRLLAEVDVLHTEVVEVGADLSSVLDDDLAGNPGTGV